MQFIYILKLTMRYEDPANWDDKANETMGRHWNYLVGLHREGVTKLVGRTSYDPGHPDLAGIAIFTAENMEAATAIMNSDPCVIEGVMTATVHPFSIALIEGKMPAGH